MFRASKAFFLVLILAPLAFLALGPDAGWAGIGSETSESTLVDTLDPELSLDPLPANTLIQGGHQLSFHWTSHDDHPSTNAQDYSAVLWIDQQPVDQVIWYPDGQEFLWTWTAPEVQTSDCHLEVTVRDQMGNATAEQSADFTVLFSTTDASDTPVAMTMDQPYPNPFNPSCSLAFSLPSPGPVQLSVFDARGRLVRGLLSASLPAGHHQIRWDGANNAGHPQSGGLYFFVLQVHDPDHPRPLIRKATLIP